MSNNPYQDPTQHLVAPVSIAPTPPPPEPTASPKPNKDIYNTSYFGIFMRNFLAGFGKSLGGVLIYAVFLAISAYSFFKVVYPKLQPILSTFEKIGNIGQGTTTLPRFDSGSTNPLDVQKALDQLKGK
jgi:hypothetical protein